MASRILPAIVAALIAACGNPEPPREAPPQEIERLTAQMRRNMDRAIEELEKSGTQAFALQRLVHIDGEKHQLTNIGAARIAPDGELLLSQPDEGELLVFSPAGELQHRFGRFGDGPGEFSVLHSFGLLGDTVWVSDQFARRTTLFALDGRVLQTIPYLGREGTSIRALLPAGMQGKSDEFRLAGPEAMSPDGIGLTVVSPWFSQGALKHHSHLPIISVTRDLRPLRLIGLRPTSEISWERGSADQKQLVSIDPPFGAEFIAFETSPGGKRMAFVTADYARSSIRILQLSFNGDTLGDRGVAFRRRPVPRQQIDGTVASLVSTITNPENAERVTKALRRLPPFYQPYDRAALGDDGTVWLAGLTDTRDVLWTVITPSGSIDGYVVMPADQFPLIVAASSLWTERIDSMMVPSISRFALSRK